MKNSHLNIWKHLPDSLVIGTAGHIDHGKTTLVGALTGVDTDRLAEEKPEGVENESVEQVCFADRVLLNKTDLADEAKLKKIEDKLRKLNPTTSIIRCQYCENRLDPPRPSKNN